MKALFILGISLTIANSVFANTGALIEEGTHNTAIIQTKNLFGPSKALIYRITGPVAYSICDKGALLSAKLIPVSRQNNEFTYYTSIESIPFGNSGKCKAGEPIETISLESQGKSPWMKANAGTTLFLVLPVEYSVEVK